MVKYKQSHPLDSLIDLRLNEQGNLVAWYDHRGTIREVPVSSESLNKQTIVTYTSGSFGMVGSPVSQGPIPERANGILIGETIESEGTAPAMFYRILEAFEVDGRRVPLEKLFRADNHAVSLESVY